MHETNEVAQLIAQVHELAAETKFLRVRVEELEQGQSGSLPAANVSSNLSKIAHSPTSRRKMLRAGVLAAGLAVTTVAASAGPLSALASDSSTGSAPVPGSTTNGHRGASPTGTNDPITVGGMFSPTNATDAPTQLYNPSSTQLSPVLFKVDNYSTANSLLALPVNTRFGIVGTASGADTGAGAGAKVGVYGASDTGYGVWGSGQNGVYGYTNIDSGNGVYAYASGVNAWGIEAQSVNSYGGWFSGGAANIRLSAGGVAPLTRADQHLAGEFLVDVNGDAWVCVAGGMPGTWRQIAGTSTAGSFHALPASARVVDTRPGKTSLATTIASSNGGTPATTFTAGEARTYSLAVGSSPVPAGATAFSAVVTATNIAMSAGQSGYFQLWTGALSPVPTGSLVTYNVAGVANAGSLIAPLSVIRQFNLYTLKATDVIIDIVGYYL